MPGEVQRVVIQAPDPTAPSGHDEKMIALVDSANGSQQEAPQVDPPASDPNRPAWLPAKFKTVEEMAQSYAELEAKQGGQKPADPPATETPPGDPADPAAAAVKSAGLDMAALNAEFAKDGSLSQASLDKLAAAGFDKKTVDSYIAGQQAIQVQFDTEVKSATPGGAEKYGEMIEWAKANLTDAEKIAFNKAVVESGDVNQAKLAVAGLGAKFLSAVGNEPNLQGGRPTAAADVYESLAQMQADMRDPRYKEDHAFRAKVAAKLGRSNIM